MPTPSNECATTSLCASWPISMEGCLVGLLFFNADCSQCRAPDILIAAMIRDSGERAAIAIICRSCNDHDLPKFIMLFTWLHITKALRQYCAVASCVELGYMLHNTTPTI